jgi:TRAP-type C4-dicarboxylate transport system permease small subunit
MNILFRVIADGIDPSKIELPLNPVGSGTIKTALSLATGIAAAVAFLLIILGGLKYVTSEGDPDSVTKAKNTILYALVGLIISMTALAIVTFVVKKI